MESVHRNVNEGNVHRFAEDWVRQVVSMFAAHGEYGTAELRLDFKAGKLDIVTISKDTTFKVT